MKLKEGFITHATGGEYIVVATGKLGREFSGMIRNNESANAIFELLSVETTEDAVVDGMCARYDAPREVIAADVHTVLEQLRTAGFLDE